MLNGVYGLNLRSSSIVLTVVVWRRVWWPVGYLQQRRRLPVQEPRLMEGWADWVQLEQRLAVHPLLRGQPLVQG